MTDKADKKVEEILSENLRLRISWLGVSWEALALSAGETPRNVRNWVNYGQPTIRKLERLANVLNVPTWALLHPEFDPRQYEKPEVAKSEED